MNEVNLKISPVAYNLIIKGLMELPFKDANPVLIDLAKQVREQFPSSEKSQEKS